MLVEPKGSCRPPWPDLSGDSDGLGGESRVLLSWIENRRPRMTIFALRPIIWSDGYSRPDDYYVIHGGQIVGRICRMDFVPKDRWCWTPIGPWAATCGTKGGLVDSLDEAKAAFRAAWERRTQEPQKWNSSLRAFQPSMGKNRISMKWADKFAVGLLAITGIVAAISALTLSVYPTATERVGAALGLFVGVAAVFVLPLWLILRLAVWVARAFRAEEAKATPPRLAPER